MSSFDGRAVSNYIVFDGQSLNNLPAPPNNYVSLMIANFANARRINIAISGASWTNLMPRQEEERDKLLLVGLNTIYSMLGGGR